MKTYENKKFYNYTLSHKRKKRTRSAKIWWKSNSWEYRRYLSKKYRNKCKTILRKKLVYEEIEFPLYKKTLWWEA